MRRTGMLGLAVIAPFVLDAAPTSAQQGGYPLYQWCAYHGGRGVANCYFSTWEQCREAASGNGGYCTVNPFYAAYGSWYSFGGSHAPRRTY
jgi:hypothetical protein